LSYGPLAAFSRSLLAPRAASSWPGAESNRRHHDFQSCALPTELPGPDKKPARASRRGREVLGGDAPTAAPLPPTIAGSTCRRPSRRPNFASVSPLAVPERGKRRQRRRFTSNSGGRIRTCDLRVMSPTSYQTAPPRNRKGKLVPFWRRGQPVRSACVTART
jgi:hypothetical protein